MWRHNSAFLHSIFPLQPSPHGNQAQRPSRSAISKRSNVYCTTATTPPVVFVLGGPGSGKGTQCVKLGAEFGLEQICVGDLLRKEARKGSELGKLISGIIRRGEIVPGHVTIDLLRDALQKREHACKGVLIDGFPRAMEQALEFERLITTCEFVIFFSCNEEELVSRLLRRGRTSGREDDTADVVKMRLQTYMEKTLPVIDYYRRKGLLREVDSGIGDADDVYKVTRTLFEKAYL